MLRERELWRFSHDHLFEMKFESLKKPYLPKTISPKMLRNKIWNFAMMFLGSSASHYKNFRLWAVVEKMLQQKFCDNLFRLNWGACKRPNFHRSYLWKYCELRSEIFTQCSSRFQLHMVKFQLLNLRRKQFIAKIPRWPVWSSETLKLWYQMLCNQLQK